MLEKVMNYLGVGEFLILSCFCFTAVHIYFKKCLQPPRL